MAQEVITATLVAPIFSSADRSWCVSKFRNRADDNVFTAVGANLPRERKVPVKLIGDWSRNRKTGQKQFEVQYTEVAPLSGKPEIVAFFVSLRCGIGRAKAEAIYRAFGARTWDVIDSHPEELMTVKGISSKLYAALKNALSASKGTQQLAKLLGKSGVSVSGAAMRKLIEELGEDAADKLQANPYAAYGIGGFSIDKAEALAESVGVPKDAQSRLIAYTQYALDVAAGNGHVCLPKMDLLSSVMQFTGVERAKCADAINAAFVSGDVKSTNGCIYSKLRYETETGICSNIARLMLEGGSPVDGLEPLIAEYEKCGIQLADRQREAICSVFSSPVSVITGGPGVGKTTVTKAILYVHEKVYGESSLPLLIAPTGKAARRLEDATKHTASTIHSAVGWRGDDTPLMDADEPLAANLIIIDEASMVDQNIANLLLTKIESGSRVVFIGDCDQLPSVGCGNVLGDIIASGVIPTTRLDVIFRQSGTNPIVANAHTINEGKSELVETNTFKFIETHTDDEAFKAACRLYLRCVKAYGVENVIILNPQRNNTRLSVDAFNYELQSLLNPETPDAVCITVGKTKFRAGDRVMELKNGPDAKNGDVGCIREIAKRPDPDDPSVYMHYAVIDFDGYSAPLEYTAEELKHVCLAWCTTVHKCQGMEYDTVIQIVSRSHPTMLKRNLVYTGITRAKKNVALIGERSAFAQAVKNDRKDIRYTLLANRLKSKLGNK